MWSFSIDQKAQCKLQLKYFCRIGPFIHCYSLTLSARVAQLDGSHNFEPVTLFVDIDYVSCIIGILSVSIFFAFDFFWSCRAGCSNFFNLRPAHLRDLGDCWTLEAIIAEFKSLSLVTYGIMICWPRLNILFQYYLYEIDIAIQREERGQKLVALTVLRRK